MYAFLGVVDWKNVNRGRFNPTYVVTASPLRDGEHRFVMQVVAKMTDNTGAVLVVNNITDKDARDMVAFACSRVQVKNARIYKGHQDWSHKRLKGVLLWYECDIYARPTGRVLFICTLPNKTFESGPVERPLTWRFGMTVPDEDLLVTVKPSLPQITKRTEKQKGRKAET